MDYEFREGDKKIIIEHCDKGKTTQRDRLFGYYSQFRSESGEISDEERSVLKRIAYSLSEKDAQERCSIIEAKQKERLSAYQKAMSSLYQKRDDELKDIKDTVSDLVEAYEDYDFDREKTVEINGNIFTFDPEQFDIEKYKDRLARLGEDSKGNTWSIEIDETGEVVLHW